MDEYGTPTAAPVAVEPPVTGPFSLPAGMSATDAALRLAELKADKEFGKRYLNGPATSREAREIDALEKLAGGKSPPEPEPLPAPEPHRPDLTLDELTPAELKLHQELFDPPASPDAYKINPGRQLDAEEQQELTHVRGWIHAAGFPVSAGEMLAEAALKEGRLLADMKPSDREAHGQKTEARLRGAWGADYSEKLKMARQFISEVEIYRPGLKSWLTETGLGNSFGLIFQIAKMAERKYGSTK